MSADSSPSQANQKKRLPFPRSLALVIGALVGVVIRLAFSADDHLFTAMSNLFVVGTPLLVGAITVFIAELAGRQSCGYVRLYEARAEATAVPP